MSSDFISPIITQASRLGVSLFEDTEPVKWLPGCSSAEIETIIRSVYRQVLGNAYVMESERLSIAESQLKQGNISVREFVRQVAQSELYRSRFFENCSRYRYIELTFKHLLGRAPDGYEEMTAHSQILDREGLEADIDSYIDSDEYQDAFGENTVPFYRGYKTQTGKRMVGFTHLFQLLRGASSSDKATFPANQSRLNRSIITDIPSAVVPPSSMSAYISSYGGFTDVNKLLADVLKPKISPTETSESTYQDYTTQTEGYQSLKRQCQEQAELIATLQQQLAELKPFGNIGAIELSKWQSYSPANTETGATSSITPQVQATNQPESYAALQQQSEEQQKAIASLQQQIAELRSVAAIGEARLNKWRNRFFG